MYSKFEIFLADILSSFPTLKKIGKYSYQRICHMMNKKAYKFLSNYDLIAIDEDVECFGGYYDFCPLDASENYIIYLESNIKTLKKPDPLIPLNLILLNIKNEEKLIVDKIYSYNWQQGCKIKWISNSEFIYNNFDKEHKKYFSFVFSVKEQCVIEKICVPVYDVFERKFFLSLNFERLNIYRPDYGYRNIVSKNSKNIDSLVEDGVCFYDFAHKKKELIVSIQEIIDLHPKPSMQGANHWINHIMISPDGRNFIFLHRWQKNGRKFDALILSDIKGEQLKILSDDGMVSHSCWYGNDKIISYLYTKEEGNKYYEINIETGDIKVLGLNVIDKYGDGHPSYIDGHLIFDTYPDKSRMQKLFAYNIKQKKLELLGEFFAPLKYSGEMRCDLHPKVSHNGKYLFIDSTHRGERGLYYLNLNLND